MKKVPISFIILVIIPNWVFSWQDTTGTPNAQIFEKTSNEYGYIVVECDSPGIDIYVDDMLVGQIPIKNPIPLPIGKHIVTYLHPDYRSLLKIYYDEKELQKYLSYGVKTVYLIPGETVKVKLWWKPYQKSITQRKKQFYIKSGIGVILVTVLLFLSVQLTH